MFTTRFFNPLLPSDGRALVLMYHRVHSPEYDPWQLSVSPENFRDHIKHVKSNYNIISVTKLIDQLKTNSLTENSLCITFDDAYICNFKIAKPILEEFACEATFFVPTKFINERKMFWWDALTDLAFTTPVLPRVLQLNSPVSFYFQFMEHAELNDELKLKHRQWTGGKRPSSERCNLFLELNNLFQSVQFDVQELLLEALLDWACISMQKEEQYVMTRQQLRMTAESPLISVGLHTNSHLALGLHTTRLQEAEIDSNRNALREMGILYTNALAYPYGNYNDSAIRTAESCGIAAAFTTDPIAVTKRSNHYALGRFLVPNIDNNNFKKQLTVWAKQKN